MILDMVQETRIQAVIEVVMEVAIKTAGIAVKSVGNSTTEDGKHEGPDFSSWNICTLY